MPDRPLLYEGDKYKPTEKTRQTTGPDSSSQLFFAGIGGGILLCILASVLDDKFGPPAQQPTQNFASANRELHIPAPPTESRPARIITPLFPGETLLNLYNGEFSPVLLGWNKEKPEDEKHVKIVSDGDNHPLSLETYKAEDGQIVSPALTLKNPIVFSRNANYIVEFEAKTPKDQKNLSPEVRLFFYNSRSEVLETKLLKFYIDKSDSWLKRSVSIGPNSDLKFPDGTLMFSIGLGASFENNSESAVGSRLYYDHVNLRGIPNRQ